jgi:hypothetical protein
VSYRFNAIPIKISMVFLTELEKIILKFIWKHKRLNSQNNLEQKKKNVGGLRTPAFKLYHRAIETKTTWYWHNNRHMTQWNSHMVLDIGAKNLHWRKDILFNKWFWEKLDIHI